MCTLAILFLSRIYFSSLEIEICDEEEGGKHPMNYLITKNISLSLCFGVAG